MDKSWAVDASTVDELLVIEQEAGVIDMLKASAPGVGDTVEEAAAEAAARMEERHE
jgi:hypothetical protein